jgi:hypothetical protein
VFFPPAVSFYRQPIGFPALASVLVFLWTSHISILLLGRNGTDYYEAESFSDLPITQLFSHDAIIILLGEFGVVLMTDFVFGSLKVCEFDFLVIIEVQRYGKQRLYFD